VYECYKTAYALYIIFALLFTLGFLTDIGLIWGCIAKNKVPIWCWIAAQFMTGSVICCCLIPIVNKAIDEINEHNKYVKPEKRYF
jgi:hypothetical protein